jgi:hypothetical protein
VNLIYTCDTQSFRCQSLGLDPLMDPVTVTSMPVFLGKSAGICAGNGIPLWLIVASF